MSAAREVLDRLRRMGVPLSAGATMHHTYAGRQKVSFSALKGRACKSPGSSGPSGLTEARSPKGHGPMVYAASPVSRAAA